MVSSFTDFAAAFDVDQYRRVPDDWSVAVSDVVDSTAAIARGRYKDVNMAGAATIAAVLNACGRDDLPFAFGGDGGVVLVPSELERKCRSALSGLQRACREVMALQLRCSVVPVAELRKRGQEVLYASHDLGSGRLLPMLAGGGIEMAEKLCKSGEGAAFAISAGEGECDLTGLSCRWEPLKPEHGVVMSLVVQAKDKSSVLPAVYRDIYSGIDAVAGAGATPVKDNALLLRFPPADMAMESTLGRGAMPRRRILLHGFVNLVSVVTGLTIAGFNAKKYRESLPRHSDFRKYADSLRMVIDCNESQAAAIRNLLEAEWHRGSIDYGTHSAKAALMTCFVRNPSEAGHVHFIDGADGGYALAALDLKRRMSSQGPIQDA